MNGRNGLHCLAEVSFDLHLLGGHSNSAPTPNNKVDHAAKLEGNLEVLLETGVDPNSHDSEGLTPFMSFVIHMRPGNDCFSGLRPSKDYYSKMRPLQLLFSAGADINRRNRQGETALMIAVKLGRSAATKFLLDHGANVHSRASNGLGVLALGYKCANKAKDNEALYAQIMLCLSLAVNCGAVSAPTILEEWGMKSLAEYPVHEDQVEFEETSWTTFEKL